VKAIAIIIVSLMFALSAAAQNDINVSADTLLKPFKPNYIPAAIRFGVDVMALVNSRVKEEFNGWEFTADTEFHRYLLVADFGYSEEQFTADVESYSNDGHYWRLGIDANFLTRDPEKNVFFLGLHYGRASYNERMLIVPTQEEQETWGSEPRLYSNDGMKAGWLELNGGLKVKIWQGIQLGYTCRFKFSLSQDKSREMLSHSVPGYGSTDRETAWGFNYYVFYRIPFRNTTAILPPKK
jgi:hypothetical protein